MQMGGSANNTRFPNITWKTNYNGVSLEAGAELLHGQSLPGAGFLRGHPRAVIWGGESRGWVGGLFS